MIDTKVWMGVARRHRGPLLALILLPILANAIALSGFFNTDPTLAMNGLGVALRGGWTSGPMGWLDPSVGYITQPVGYLAASDWLHGVIPWWDPYSGVGMPLAAEMEASALFMPFVLLLHFNCGWLLLRVVLQMLCGLFGYALFVELGLTRAAAFLGAGLYALSPLFFLSPHAAIAPLPFLPLLLLGIERSAEAAMQSRRMGWSLVAVAVAYSVYAGFPEVAYLDGLLACVWSLWRLATIRADARWQLLGKLCLGVGIGVALSAPQLIPFLAYLPDAYVGGHGTTLFESLDLNSSLMPLQILPFLYGPFGSLAPPQFYMIMGGGFVRVPGWVGIPVLTLALAALWRRGNLPSLRIVLLLFVATWEARYAGVSPVTWLINAVPGVAATDSTRFSGPVVNFAVYALAAFGFDDLWRLGPVPRARLAAIALTLAAIVAAAILPNLGFIHGWYRVRPGDISLAAATSAASAALLVFLCFVLRRPAHPGGLAAILLIGPVLTLLLPQFGGFRSGHIDMAPIAFLQRHAATSRMISLGPLDLNFPNRYDIATINYLSLPVPALYTDYVANKLFSQNDPISQLVRYDGGQTGQAAALRAHLPDYEAIGVRYILTGANDAPGWLDGSAIAAQPHDSARVLMPGGADVTGTFTPDPPMRAVGGISVVVGTYMGAARGTVMATLCAGTDCAAATADAGSAADNAPLVFMFPAPLQVPAGSALTYRFSHPAGTPIAVWFGPDAHGIEQPTLRLLGANQGPAAARVFHDAMASIYELPQAAVYAQTSNPACTLDIVNRQDIRTVCPTATILTRRELFFPGWEATVAGRHVAISQAGLFQTVPVPAGPARVRFRYAPPHIQLACALALLALALWLGLAIRGCRPLAIRGRLSDAV